MSIFGPSSLPSSYFSAETKSARQPFLRTSKAAPDPTSSTEQSFTAKVTGKWSGKVPSQRMSK